MLIITTTFVLTYCLLVRQLRHRRVSQLPDRKLPEMTLLEAWAIHKTLVEYEFPTTFALATMFALFKAYAIPSIAKVLGKTGRFHGSQVTDRRIANTSCLLLEAALTPPGESRCHDAIARINFLHKRPDLTNDEMLYTLYLFACEPCQWVGRYEWRQLTTTEVCALGVIWKKFRDAFNISYEPLSSNETGWVDGTHWIRELERWAMRYRHDHIGRCEDSEQIAKSTLDRIIALLPFCIQPHVCKLIACLLGGEICDAMGIPRPSSVYHICLRVVLSVRRFFLLHICLPRFTAKQRCAIPVKRTGQEGSADIRLSPRTYINRPWYIKPTFYNRYGFKALVIRFLGGILPGDDGEAYCPYGFRSADLGPHAQVGKGSACMDADKQRIKRIMCDDQLVFGRGRGMSTNGR